MLKKIKNNSLIKNTGIYTFTKIVNSAIPFFLLPVLTRYLTQEEYGLVSMFSLLVTFVNPFIGLNLHGAITRQYFKQEKINFFSYVGNCFLLLFLSVGVVSFVFYLGSEIISDLTSFPSKMLWSVIVFSFGQFIVKVVSTIWRVKKVAISYSIFNISKAIVNISFSMTFVVLLSLGWQGRIWGQIISAIFFSILAIIILVKNQWIQISINKKYLGNALLFGVPLIPHAMSGSIISMTDRLFLTNLIGLGATGVYTVGYQVGSIINLLVTSFNLAYVPWLFERLKKNEIKTKIKIVKFTYIYFGGLLFLAVILGLGAPFVLELFLGKDFYESISYVIWISLGYAFNGMYIMVVNYIFYVEKTKYLAGITFLVALVNIILNYFLILRFGAIGAAQATTITFFVKFIAVWLISSKLFNMPWRTALKRKEDI